jgi:hypothetical protein
VRFAALTEQNNLPIWANQSRFGNFVMTLLYMPIWRDDMFHVEQFAFSAHFLRKIEEKCPPFYLAATADG